jgi:hypothetical protein
MSTPRFATNFPPVDRLFGGGWHPGTVNIIQGMTAIGKTGFMLRLACGGSDKAMVCNGEDSPERIVDRASKIGLPMGNVRLVTNGWEQMSNEILLYRPSVVYIDDYLRVRLPGKATNDGLHIVGWCNWVINAAQWPVAFVLLDTLGKSGHWSGHPGHMHDSHTSSRIEPGSDEQNPVWTTLRCYASRRSSTGVSQRWYRDTRDALIPL